MKTLITAIAAELSRLHTVENSTRFCDEQKASIRLDAEDRLFTYQKNHLPSGSGVDRGCKIDLDDSGPEKIVITFGFHHMDEHGSYDGWTDHKAIITPSLHFGFNLRITGKDRNGIKEYLSDLFHRVLSVLFAVCVAPSCPPGNAGRTAGAIPRNQHPATAMKDNQTLISAATRFGNPIPVYDDGYGPLWIHRDSMGISGIVRARTWEDAYGICEDEFFPAATETEAGFVADYGENFTEDACWQEAYGFRNNSRREADGTLSGLYQKDLNGDSLDRLTPALIEALEITLVIETENESD
jgi:hypothetical protein